MMSSRMTPSGITAKAANFFTVEPRFVFGLERDLADGAGGLAQKDKNPAAFSGVGPDGHLAIPRAGELHDGDTPGLVGELGSTERVDFCHLARDERGEGSSEQEKKRGFHGLRTIPWLSFISGLAEGVPAFTSSSGISALPVKRLPSITMLRPEAKLNDAVSGR